MQIHESEKLVFMNNFIAVRVLGDWTNAIGVRYQPQHESNEQDTFGGGNSTDTRVEATACLKASDFLYHTQTWEWTTSSQPRIR